MLTKYTNKIAVKTLFWYIEKQLDKKSCEWEIHGGQAQHKGEHQKWLILIEGQPFLVFILV